MLEPGLHCRKGLKNINDELLSLKGTLTDEKAQETFALFLRSNPSLACQILFGIELYPFQDIAIRSMFKKDFVLNIWSRGLSKCENKESLVFTNRGLIKMKDVEVGDYVQSKIGQNIVLAKTDNPKDTTYKVTTKLGYQTEGLDYHRVLTLNKNLNEEWKFAKDLTPGDILIMRKNSSINCPQVDIFALQRNVRRTVQSNHLILNKNYNDWYYFFGLLIGDGHVSRNSFKLTTVDNDILEFLKNFAQSNNLRYKIYENSSRSKLFEINSYSFISYLENCGFNFKDKAAKKTIPAILTAASLDNISFLLKGLFDTDGYTSVQTKKSGAKFVSVGFTSSSLELIKQVRSLLLLFGISSKTNTAFKGGLSSFGGKLYECNKAWKITISSQHNLRIYKEKINFLIKRKSELLNCLDAYKYQKEEFSNYVPFVGDYLIKKYGKKSFRSRKNNLKLNFRKNTSKNLIEKLVNSNFLDLDDNQKISKLLNPDLFFEEVELVETTECETVDIQVANEACYVTDGVISHNSWSAAVFIALYAIFNPGVKIGICSKTFRQSKIIFKNIHDLSQSKKGVFFKECLKNVKKGSEAWEMEIGHKILSRIYAVPLGDGAKIRGYRFDVMVIDELLLLSDQVINEVIRPFLVVNTDPIASLRLKEALKTLVETGEITEEEAQGFSFTGKKLIGLSSASYKFEYLYSMYSEYMKKITNPIDPRKPEEISHVISQYSHEVAPPGLMNSQQIAEARASMSAAQFSRELQSQFTDDSAGFFSAQRMKEATIPDGELPCTRIYGNPNKKYILSIDPNYNDSESSDHFAMAITELDEENRSGTLVHNYALAKSNIAARTKYLKYILDHFNIVFIIVDKAGGKKFINDANELDDFKSAGINLQFIEDVNFMDENYIQTIDDAKKQYSLQNKKICFAQYFEPKWIRAANEHLQASIEKKKILFASAPSENEFALQLKSKIPIEELEFADEHSSVKEGKLAEFVDHQAFLIDLTKTECALIEVSSTASGNQTFDLPPNLRKSTAPDKPRKDSYTALLLNNWGIKCYFDMIFAPEKKREAFIPMRF